MRNFESRSTESSETSGGSTTGESANKVCFVVMPFGRDTTEQRWFKGWFEAVIKPGVLAAGYRPVLAAAEEQPGAINDEIRAHLAFDPMVVVDLGGMEPDDNPNPNVMYELGIRHAFGLPLVIMAWEGQRLPFDVSNQRAITEPRDMLSIDANRAKLTSFIKAASEGKYYRPMEAVARIATIEAASTALGEESILTALVQEVRDLKGVVATAAFPKHTKPFRQFRPTIKHALRGKVFRKELYPHFVASGGASEQWSHFLNSEISQEFADAAHKWGNEEWKEYVARRAKDFAAAAATIAPAHFKVVVSDDETQPVSARVIVTEELIAKVRAELPEQPWPSGTHKLVREKLSISGATYDLAVSELIRRGVFSHQINGVLVKPGTIASSGEPQ